MLLPVVYLRPHKLLPWDLGFLSSLVLSVVRLLGSWVRRPLPLAGHLDYCQALSSSETLFLRYPIGSTDTLAIPR